MGDGAGGVRVKGRGSAEGAALLEAALLPLPPPTPAVDDEHDDVVHDPRDAGARMWDALVATAQHALDTDLPPHTHGAPTRLLVTIALDHLQSGLADDAVTEPSISTIRRLACDAEARARLFDYIWTYNHHRRQSTLGYVAPIIYATESSTCP